MNDKKSDHQHLDGVTLENLLTLLVDSLGWATLAELVRINCFRSDPSIKSSLKFLRKTPWARAQVETVFCALKDGEDVAQIRQRLKAQARPRQQNMTQKNNPAADPWAKAKQKQQQ